uniref:Uncharacterized protein n=1 Tax=Haptolina ericina TaxID=156174 RepID=A0A7S3F1E3_9EUKA
MVDDASAADTAAEGPEVRHCLIRHSCLIRQCGSPVSFAFSSMGPQVCLFFLRALQDRIRDSAIRRALLHWRRDAAAARRRNEERRAHFFHLVPAGTAARVRRLCELRRVGSAAADPLDTHACVERWGSVTPISRPPTSCGFEAMSRAGSW